VTGFRTTIPKKTPAVNRGLREHFSQMRIYSSSTISRKPEISDLAPAEQLELFAGPKTADVLHVADVAHPAGKGGNGALKGRAAQFRDDDSEMLEPTAK
jgi:hypothetical protein